MIIIIFTCFLPENALPERSLLLPLVYPNGTVSTGQPWILWNDIYNMRDRRTYRIIFREKGGSATDQVTYTFIPGIFFKSYYAWQLPAPLKGMSYDYTIEMLVNSKPENLSYNAVYKYPIMETFTVDTARKNSIDRLPPEYLIKYKFMEKENGLINGYNFIFYASSSTLTLGLGFLFYTIFNFGTVAVVLSWICFGTSLMGYTAAGYYGYRYMVKKGEMNEILRMGENISIKGMNNGKKMDTGIELSF